MKIDDFLKNVIGSQNTIQPHGVGISVFPIVPNSSRNNTSSENNNSRSTEMPEYIYKYCKKSDYKKYYLKGIFQLCSLQKYRNDYENSCEYADPNEANPTLKINGPITTSNPDVSVGNQGSIIIDIDASTAYAFCTSENYCPEMHRTWHNREGCKYDFCLKIEAKPFLKHMIRRLNHRLSGDINFQLGRPVFLQNIHEGPLQSQGDAFFVKTDSANYRKEKEFRLVCAVNNKPNDSYLLEYALLAKFIVDTFDCPKP